MLPIALTVLGFIFGWRRAARRGGVRADKWQYALAHAIAAGLIGMILAAILVRSGLFPNG